MPWPKPASFGTDRADQASALGAVKVSPLVKFICGYGFALVAASLAAYLSFRSPALQGIRLALNFSVIATAAAFFGPGQAVFAVLVTIISFEHYLPPATNSEHPGLDRLTRAAVIVLAGGLISLIIRQRHRAEQGLRSALATLQEQADALIQAQQASGSAAWTFNTATRTTRWYEGGAEIFGRPHAQITAMGSPTSLVLAEDRPKIAAAALHTESTGAPFNVEFRVLWPNREVHWLEARGAPIAGNPQQWRGATIDVTERKRAEAVLVRTEKLAAAGRLAASIAHEINNPLEAVINLCYLAKMTAADAETKSYIEMAEEELNRVAHITSQTLRFHRQQTAPAETDLGEMARAIVDLYEAKLAQSGIAVSLECQAAPPLLCYAGEIRQVLANLVANAIDALPDGGTLRLRVRPTTDWRSGSSAVRVTVADDGTGMSADTQRRIYEPFYTTKGEVGTGLGLWVSAGIVEKHKGSLRVRSRVRGAQGSQASGSVFALLLPYPATPLAMVALEADLDVVA
jgi:PAS domain S-box-containing protein